MISLLILLAALNSVHAQDLSKEFKGRWKRRAFPRQAIVIHPDHVKFRFCKKVNITAKRDLGFHRHEGIGLTQYTMEYDLYSRGDRDTSCLSRGHHNCSFTIGKWDEYADKMDLTLACDDSETVRMYEKRIYPPRSKKHRDRIGR